MSHPLIRTLFYSGYCFLYVPIALIILYSFNSSSTIRWEGFSLTWYKTLAANTQLLEAAFVSLKIAVLSATFSVVLGTACASLLMRERGSYSTLGYLAILPLVIPEMVIGLSLLLFFSWLERRLGWPQRGVLSVTLAHTLLGAAYVTTIVKTRLASIHHTLTEAALDLGARPYQVFLLIKLPIIMPSLFAGWLIAFIISFDDVILASFTSGPGTTTLPLMIFSSLKVGYTPQINALATCIIAMVTVLIINVGYVVQRRGSL